MVEVKGYNENEHEAAGSFELLPENWYKAQVITSVEKPTKSGNGNYLELLFQILDGDHKNRKIYYRLNVDNPNQQTVNIAFSNLKALHLACGVTNFRNTEQIHGKPLEIRVSITPAKGAYQERNDIKGFRSIENIPAFDEGEPSDSKTVDARENGDEIPDWLKDHQ